MTQISVQKVFHILNLFIFSRRVPFKKYVAPPVNDSDTKKDNTDQEVESVNMDGCMDIMLIELVRKHRLLYDCSHQSYGNSEKTKKTWEKIGKICSLSGSNI